MGVSGLWSILAPTKKYKPLRTLHGQTLAIDLSIWICENQGVRNMQNKVLRPHLRNLFFRISGLIQHDIKPIFIIEGEAPRLKYNEINKRLKARGKGGCDFNKVTRSCFKFLLRECCELLDALGVPYLQSNGEAESLCAALNAAGIVDACVTDDSDCFLYGATVVYKNLTSDSKDPHVESYSMVDITAQLGLTREKLVALGLLLGCDYYSTGVPGIGEVWAMKLINSLAEIDILSRFSQWQSMVRHECVDCVELFVWQKASAIPDFPPSEVIEEFMILKEEVPHVLPSWKRPQFSKMIELCSKYLEWPSEYTQEKVLPLVTLWDQLDLLQSSPSSGKHIHPLRILKQRIKKGISYFEVEWDAQNEGLVTGDGHFKMVTLEELKRFEKVFPYLVEEFSQRINISKPHRKQGARAQNKCSEFLNMAMENLTVDTQKKSVEFLNVAMENQTFDTQKKSVEFLNVAMENQTIDIQKKSVEFLNVAMENQTIDYRGKCLNSAESQNREVSFSSPCIEEEIKMPTQNATVCLNSEILDVELICNREKIKKCQIPRISVPSFLLRDWSDDDEENDDTGDVSFISDGHFTMYHSLFSSPDCTPYSRSPLKKGEPHRIFGVAQTSLENRNCSQTLESLPVYQSETELKPQSISSAINVSLTPDNERLDFGLTVGSDEESFFENCISVPLSERLKNRLNGKVLADLANVNSN